MNLNETEALTILTATPGLGPVKNKLIINFFGSASEALRASKEEITNFPNLSVETKNQWGWWTRNKAWEDNLRCADREGVKLIPYTSREFPQKLLELPDHPLLLYVKGEIKESDARGIAVVGTRSPSVYGLEMAQKISKDLPLQGFTVVSGLARGIDTGAHKGALETGRTIAVIGSGLANLYPRENETLAQKIVEKGALISEFPMNTPPDRKNFPQRNRIVSGMTLGCLLIEAPKKSGAMITMEKAFQQKRKLYALPGRADHENFKGNHFLIKLGTTILVENARDIAESFDNLFNINAIIQIKSEEYIHLEKEEIDLLKKMPSEELNIQEIIQLSELPIIKLNILLMSLIMKKVIKEYPGKIYKKIGIESVGITHGE